MNGYARTVHVDGLAVRVGELTDSVAYLLEVNDANRCVQADSSDAGTERTSY